MDRFLLNCGVRGSPSVPSFFDLGFGVWGLGFRVWALGFGVWGLGPGGEGGGGLVSKYEKSGNVPLSSQPRPFWYKCFCLGLSGASGVVEAWAVPAWGFSFLELPR